MILTIILNVCGLKTNYSFVGLTRDRILAVYLTEESGNAHVFNFRNPEMNDKNRASGYSISAVYVTQLASVILNTVCSYFPLRDNPPKYHQIMVLQICISGTLF